MNARKDRLTMLFKTSAPSLSGDNELAPPARVTSGSVRSMKDSFSGIERENETLREALSSGSAVLDLDPSVIEPSPVRDRLDDAKSVAFDTLKESMERHGQEVPILVRPHPTQPDRFQAAYGHRRLRAALELGISVKAVVRALSEQELVIAQGLENAARLDLTFIERAVFALRLETAGHDRQVIQGALNIDRAEASKLILVARQIPLDIIEAIGRAPKIGRPRWLALAEVASAEAARNRMRREIEEETLAQTDSDSRFLQLLAAALDIKKQRDGNKTQGVIASEEGAPIARVRQSNTGIQISFDRSGQEQFGAFVTAELPALFARFSGKDRSPPDA